MKIRLVKMKSGKFQIQEHNGYTLAWEPCKRVVFPAVISTFLDAEREFRHLIEKYEQDKLDAEIDKVLDIYG